MNDYRPPLNYPHTAEYYFGVIDTCAEIRKLLETSPALPVQLLYDKLWALLDDADVALKTIGDEAMAARSNGRL